MVIKVYPVGHWLCFFVHMKSALQKRIRVWLKIARGKLLGCSIRHTKRIRVRTKWQSSPASGDRVETGLKGNHRYGNSRYLSGKTYWT